MDKQRAGRCQSCGAREPVLRAVYDWQRTQRDGAWVWLGAARALCTKCFADPRLRARWIDERQKRTPAKPMWAKDEPEEFGPAATRARAAVAPRGGEAKEPARPRGRSRTGAKKKSAARRR